MLLELFIAMLALHLKHLFLLLNSAFMTMQQAEFRQEIRSIICDEIKNFGNFNVSLSSLYPFVSF